MKTQTNLFELIKSLTQSEKRYFKIYATRHVLNGSNKYVKLFNIIEKQNQYSEFEIRQKFHNDRFVNQLPAAKNYLYNLILESLNSYHRGKSSYSTINALIESVRTLYEKTLYEQAAKVLAKARALASAYESFPQLIEIYSWMQQLLQREQYTRQIEEKLKKIYQEESETLNKMENLSKYSGLQGRVLVIHTKSPSLRGELEKQRVIKFLENRLLSGPEKALSCKAKNLYYNIVELCLLKLGNHSEIYRLIKEHVNLIETNPFFLKENIREYLLVLADMVAVLGRLKKYDELDNTIAKLENLPHQHLANVSENFYRTIMINCSYSRLTVYIESCEFDRGLSLMNSLVPQLNSLSEQLNMYRLSAFYFQFAKLTFIKGNCAASIKWLNKIINDKTGQVTDENLSRSRILNLLVHFDLNDFDLLEYEVKSTYRYLSKRQKLYRFESTILDYMRKAFRTKTEGELLELFVELRSELENLVRDPFQKKPLDSLALIPWLESKITKKPFADVLTGIAQDRPARAQTPN
jgi:uncharacterized protein YeeX (DUF496 family)